jgi:hypothetical protein
MTTPSGPGGCRRSLKPRDTLPDEENGFTAPDAEAPTARGIPDEDIAPELETASESVSSVRASGGSSVTSEASRAEVPPDGRIAASATSCDVATPGDVLHSMSALSGPGDSARGRAAAPPAPSRKPSSRSLAANSSMAWGVSDV